MLNMTRAGLLVRDATLDDAVACASIYAPYVTGTPVTFEVEPPGPGEMAERIAAALASHAWVVVCDSGSVVGYAYAASYRSRAAYRWSCEVSVYVEMGRRLLRQPEQHLHDDGLGGRGHEQRVLRAGGWGHRAVGGTAAAASIFLPYVKFVSRT